MRLSREPLIKAAEITRRTGVLGRQIARAAKGEPLILVAVLKGALPFAADLLRRIPGEVALDFIRVHSYAGTQSSGRLEVSVRPEISLTGRNVLLVEDILDTGRTASHIMAAVLAMEPASLRLCALLDKPVRRVMPVEADFVGFTIEDHFVVGYGLDYNESYRNLPSIYRLEEE